MKKPEIAIIQFPGSNCERETILAVKRAGMLPVEFLWNESTEKLNHVEGFILVGGFSYEDRSRAGVIAALDSVMLNLKKQSAWGKPILGICNGAQILVESGLVPGLENNKLALVLTDNKRVKQNKVLGTGFYNSWVNIRPSDNFQYNAFTRCLSTKSILNVPVAHAEGRFVISPGLLMEIEANGLNVFQYCDDQGKIIDEFPINPNGSVNNIAGISNKAGNVLALMPHPERTVNGDAIFKSMRAYIESGYKQKVQNLNYFPRYYEVKPFQPQGHELIVELIITDNQAFSVANALKLHQMPLKISRQIHWEILIDSSAELNKIKNSGVLYNTNKERLTKMTKPLMGKTFLVRSKEDMIGQQKLQMLKTHFDIKGVRQIQHSVLWHVEGDEHSINQVIDSHILFNPYAHDCYYY